MDSLFDNLSPYYFTTQEEKLAKAAFNSSPNISIDYAIMEKIILKKYKNLFQVAVLPCDFGWSDLGAWNTLHDIKTKDDDNNVKDGNIIAYNSHNCIIKTPKNKLVVMSGLENFIVAEHGNVLLIVRREDQQNLKTFYRDAQEKGVEFI